MLSPRLRRLTLSYGLLAPAFAVSLLLIIYPFAVTVEYSLKPGATMNILANRSVPLSLAGYSKVLSSGATWASLGRSWIYTLGSLLPSYAIGLGTALILNRSFPGRRIARTLIILPWSVPGVVACIMFLWMMDASYGVVNYLLSSLRLIDHYRAWFYEPSLVMASVILPTVWKGYPFFTLTILAALQSIPREQYEAASVDGCGVLKQFIHVTWPGIRDTSILSLILNGLWSFRVFELIYPLTKGGPNRATTTIAIDIYNEAFSYFDINRASVLGVVAFVVCAAVVFAFYPLMQKESHL